MNSSHLTLNHYIELIDFYFISIRRYEPLELLAKANSKAQVDHEYRTRLEHAVCFGSTVELRAVLTEFGPYFGQHHLAPELRVGNQINSIDNAIHQIRSGLIEGITFFNSLHN